MFCFGVLIFFKAVSQKEVESSQIKNVEKSLAAPNTASLGRYFDIPVNMSTGVPAVQIPIYEIKTGNIRVPITLTYNCAGNKVNAPVSWVGFGWDLNCGGVVMKQVNGLDDYYATSQYPVSKDLSPTQPYSDYLNPNYGLGNDALLGFTNMSDVIESMRSATYIQYDPAKMDAMYHLLGRVILSQYDGESDEYSYSTFLGSGKIFYNQKDGTYQINEQNGWITSHLSDEVWALQANNGIMFNFTDLEKSMSPYFVDAPASHPDKYFTSAWYLTSIADPVNNKQVVFENESSPFTYLSDLNIWERTEDWMLTSPPTYTAGNTNYIMRYGNQITVKKISFPEGTIEFIKESTPRSDGGVVNALKTIKIYDKLHILKKQFELNYFYAWNENANTSRLFLQSIQEINYLNGSVTQNKPYVFNYNMTAMPPKSSLAQDIWGYNNGKTNNTTTIPTIPELVAMGIPAYANRDVDPAFTQSGIMTEIKYPTGGSTKFEFENNRDDANNLVGGLRVKTITQFDNVTNSNMVTEYRYVDENGNSSGRIANRPVFHYFYQEGDYGEMYGRITSNPVFPLFKNQGSPVTYTTVEKVEKGIGTELKTRFRFFDGISTSSVSPDAIYRNSIGVPFNKESDLQRFSYMPWETEVLKKQSDGTYKTIQKDEQQYIALNNYNNYIWNVQAAWGKSNWGIFTEWKGFDPYSRIPMDPIPYINAYKLFKDKLVNNLSLKESTDDNNVKLTQTINREYDQTNGNLKVITTTASNGDILKTYTSYVCEFKSAGTPSDPILVEFNSINSNNISDLPVEIISTRKKPNANELVTSAVLFLYENSKEKKTFVFNSEVPFSSFTPAYKDNSGFHYDSRYRLENEVELFDANKNPVQLKLRDKKQSIIWDGEEVIAVVNNSDFSNIAATSFETDAKGNWNYSGQSVGDNTAPTGSKVYDLGSGNLSSSMLDATKEYIVSYWSKTGPKTVNGISAQSGLSVNGWVYYEHKIPSATAQVTISGSGNIDEVRLYPKEAAMNTYTYLPLIGIQTVCNANNQINYYEYDGFARLITIRDIDKNIVKTMDYQYQTFGHSNAVWQSTGQTRCKPCPSNSNYITNIQQHEEKDINTESLTYNTPRWVDDGVSSNCVVTADWQNTGTVSCETANSQNTGYQVFIQMDMNPCSSTYTNTRTNRVYNPTACPIPASCNTSNCSGVDKKCVNGVCETGVRYNTSSVHMKNAQQVWVWRCTYHYQWSDGSVSQNYTEDNSYSCPLGGGGGVEI